jgi:hypothetical protein
VECWNRYSGVDSLQCSNHCHVVVWSSESQLQCQPQQENVALCSINIKLVSRNCKPAIIQQLFLLKSQILTEVNIKTTFNSWFVCLYVFVCDACRLTLDEEFPLIMFRDRVLRHYVEARNNLFCSPDTNGALKSTVTQVVMQHACQR